MGEHKRRIPEDPDEFKKIMTGLKAAAAREKVDQATAAALDSFLAIVRGLATFTATALAGAPVVGPLGDVELHGPAASMGLILERLGAIGRCEMDSVERYLKAFANQTSALTMAFSAVESADDLASVPDAGEGLARLTEFVAANFAHTWMTALRASTVAYRRHLTTYIDSIEQTKTWATRATAASGRPIRYLEIEQLRDALEVIHSAFTPEESDFLERLGELIALLEVRTPADEGPSSNQGTED